MRKLDPTIKARWVAALRGGAYQQGACSLRDAGNGFCCLGVLCDIIDPGQWIPNGDNKSWGYVRSAITGFPPHELRASLAFDWDETLVTIDGKEKTLYAHNDDGCTFAQIADAIEEQL